MSDVNSMQAQIRALEAQLAAAKEQEAADPDGEYILEEYEEEEYGDDEDGDVYVIEEYIDDGQEFDDEMIEIVEEYEDDGAEYEEEYEEVIEDEEYEEGPVDPAPAASNSRGVSATRAAVVKPAPPPDPKPTAPSPRNLRPTAPAAAAAATVAAAGAATVTAPIFGNVRLKKTGIKLEETPSPSPYTFGAPPKARAPKAVPAEEPKAHSFLEGVQQSMDRDAEKEDNALRLANDEPGTEAQPRKKWVPMKDRNPEKHPKNTIELREKPISYSTRLAPLPFKLRTYPNVPASTMGFEKPAEKMMGSYLYKNVKLDRVNVTAAIQDQEILLLYFGASWRAGCKAFHQQLIDFYKLTCKDCNLECVYVSADRTLFEFKDIFSTFPFLAMPTGTAEYKNQMTKDFKILDMPAVIVLNAQTCEVITLEGVEDISSVPARDREFSQKMVAKWKTQKSAPAAKAAPATQKKAAPAKQKKAAPAAAPAAAHVEAAPAPAAAEKTTSTSAKGVGRKEKKGLFSWRKA